jgi:hypothetical protein
MKTKKIYTAPALELIEVIAERGFAASVTGNDGGTDYYPGGNVDDI